MFCAQCGTQNQDGARFCSACGAPLAAQPAAAWQVNAAVPLTRLYRPREHRTVAGVCAGLATHYGWDLTWVRVITVLITIFSSGAGLIAYVAFWIIMPEQPYALPQSTTVQSATVMEPPPAP